MKSNELRSNYAINVDGNVRSLKTNRFLKHDLSTGYARVTLSNNKVKKKFLVHRLVAMEFIPNTHNKPCVNHIDGDKLNNNINNLEWCTYSENERHSRMVLGKKIKHSEETKIKMSKSAKGRDTTKAVIQSLKTRGVWKHQV